MKILVLTEHVHGCSYEDTWQYTSDTGFQVENTATPESLLEAFGSSGDEDLRFFEWLRQNYRAVEIIEMDKEQ